MNKTKEESYREKFIEYLKGIDVPDPESLVEGNLNHVKMVAKGTKSGYDFLKSFYYAHGGD